MFNSYSPAVRKSLVREFTIIGCVIAILAIAVPLTGVFNYREGLSKKINGAVTAIDPSSPPPSFSGILVAASLNGFDANNQNIKFHMMMSPVGSFLALNGTDSRGRLAQNVTISANGRTTTFAANATIPPQDFTFPMVESDLNNYPLDKYNNTYYFLATTTGGRSVPVAFVAYGAIQGFSLDYVITEGKDDSGEYLEFTIYGRRSVTTKFFAFFVAIMMWVISLSIFSFSVIFCFMPGAEAPPVAIGTALLFALPALRNSAPGVPPIGTTSDVSGFFWNMLLVAIASMILIARYMYKKVTDHAAKVDAELKKEAEKLTGDLK